VWSYVQANKSTLINYILSLLNSVPQNPNVPAPPAPQVAIKLLARMRKASVVVLLAFALFGTSYAGNWVVPSKPLGLDKLSIGEVAENGEDDFLIMPIVDTNWTPSENNSYGMNACYGLVYAKVKPFNANSVSVSPYFFVGAFAGLDLGQWIAANGTEPIGSNFGIVAGFPKLDDSIPEIAVQLMWDKNGASPKISIDLSFPLMIFPNTLVHKL
jgi:hypothetical protein